jgi:Rieske Fe-S protein
VVPTDASVDTALACRGRDVGAVESFALETWTAVPSLSSVIAHDARGLYAYSLLCTHFACLLPVPTSGISLCPCHASRFDGEGRVQPGSIATRDLPHYMLRICNGRVFLDATTMMPMDTRTPVP